MILPMERLKKPVNKGIHKYKNKLVQFSLRWGTWCGVHGGQEEKISESDRKDTTDQFQET